LAQVTREFLLAACPDKKDVSIRAVGNRIVVQADSAVQMEATMLLQKFDVYSTSTLGFGGGQPTSGGGFFNVRPRP
jgi:hypothetical protein